MVKNESSPSCFISTILRAMLKEELAKSLLSRWVNLTYLPINEKDSVLHQVINILNATRGGVPRGRGAGAFCSCTFMYLWYLAQTFHYIIFSENRRP